MNTKKLCGVAAIAGLLFVTAPAQQANAVSLNNPGTGVTIQGANDGLTTQVQYRRYDRVYRPYDRGYRPAPGFHSSYGWNRPYIGPRHRSWNRPYYGRGWR